MMIPFDFLHLYSMDVCSHQLDQKTKNTWSKEQSLPRLGLWKWQDSPVHDSSGLADETVMKDKFVSPLEQDAVSFLGEGSEFVEVKVTIVSAGLLGK